MPPPLGNHLRRAWNSPTLTAWGSQIVGPIRLLAVTPLLVTRFSPEELSAWYLFGSAAGFCGILAGRVAYSFSQMIAFGMGGARDAKPIARAPVLGDNAGPNWDLVERVFATMGSINLLLSLATVAASAILSGWALVGVLDHASAASARDIWWAFALFNAGVLVELLCRQYASALRGAGHVALGNRSDIIVNLLSVCASILALWLGAGIAVLMAVNQGIATLGQSRFLYLLRLVEDGRFARFRRFAWDRSVVADGLLPSWHGFLQALGSVGAYRLSGVVLARTMEASASASYLFTLNMVFALAQYAETPFRSLAPYWGKELAKGSSRLAAAVRKRTRLSLWLLAGGLLVLSTVGPAALELIGARTPLLSRPLCLLMGLLFMVRAAYGLAFGACALGNNIVCYREQMVVGIVSSAALFWAVSEAGVLGALLALLVPQLLFLRLRPLREAESMLALPRGQALRDSCLPVAGYVAGAALILSLGS
jgi:hypothetical protein